MNVTAPRKKQCIAPSRSACAVLILVFVAACSGSPAQMRGKPQHHVGGGFQNPPGNPTAQASVPELAAFFWRRLRQDRPVVPAGHVIPRADALAAFTASAGEDTLTWLGHASFLIRVSGKTILTDPFLGEGAGPIGFGPKRYTPPGLALADLPPIDIVLVAIGAYEPRSIMQAAHVTPEEALDLAEDIGARRAIGMHWGTIELTDEPPFEPPRRFRAAAQARGWAAGRARVMRIGETLCLADSEFDEPEQRRGVREASEGAFQSGD